ncbi:arabinogalactan protein 13-like [Zingiber officinale]|uniref:arabinogalactan protein 13-like n=1 Tax=Zingiber officinale TaxID=94328 RepID=UPI001C4CCBA8|nr:arabinogalactan protein 13-like [Zingiber officinale]
MEAALKHRLFAIVVIAVVVASSFVEKAAAAEAPAPGPASGAGPMDYVSVPAVALAAFFALRFGYFVF